MHRCQLWFVFCLVTVLWLVPYGRAATPPPSPPASVKEGPSAPDVHVMRQALRRALNLQFDRAFDQATTLKHDQEATSASQLTEGMITYFQQRWDPPQATRDQPPGRVALRTMLEDEQAQPPRAQDDPWRTLLMGTAAIFDGLFLRNEGSWQSQQRFAQGRQWLQEALIAHHTASDAHLGLGLTYFAATGLSGPLRFLARNTAQMSPKDAIYHLRQAITHGTFSQEIAQTFLAQLYEEEHQYEEAIRLSQKLQQTFPANGYYAMLTGRNQCALRRFADCAATLGKLAARLAEAPAMLTQRDDRFALYYHWGTALNELEKYAPAFRAFRRAINLDLQATKDDTLWAKFHLARLYERRGQLTTARQLYETLLRGRNVDDLQQRVTQRLTHLR